MAELFLVNFCSKIFCIYWVKSQCLPGGPLLRWFRISIDFFHFHFVALLWSRNCHVLMKSGPCFSSARPRCCATLFLLIWNHSSHVPVTETGKNAWACLGVCACSETSSVCSEMRNATFPAPIRVTGRREDRFRTSLTAVNPWDNAVVQFKWTARQITLHVVLITRVLFCNLSHSCCQLHAFPLSFLPLLFVTLLPKSQWLVCKISVFEAEDVLLSIVISYSFGVLFCILRIKSLAKFLCHFYFSTQSEISN